MAKFLVSKWQDGAVEVTPESWISADRKAGLWPSHIQDRSTLTTAVQHLEAPEKDHWTKMLIIKVYGAYDTYRDAVDKVKRLTSEKMKDITSSDTDGNNNTTADKRRRRIHARKRDGSADSPDECVLQKKTKTSKTALPQIPLPPAFIATSPEPCPATRSVTPAIQEEPNKNDSKNNPNKDDAKNNPNKHDAKNNPNKHDDAKNDANIDSAKTDSKKNSKKIVSGHKNSQKISSSKLPLKGSDCRISETSLTTDSAVQNLDHIDEWISSVEAEMSKTETTSVKHSTAQIDVQNDIAYRSWVVQSIGTLKLQIEMQSETMRSIQDTLKLSQLTSVERTGATQAASVVAINVLWDMFPLNSVKEINDLSRRAQQKSFLNELIALFAALGGSTVKACTDTILERMISYEAAMLYSWEGGKKKLLFKNTGLFKIILGAVRVLKKDATEFEVKSRVCYFLAHAKEKFTRLQNKTKKDLGNSDIDEGDFSTVDLNELAASGDDTVSVTHSSTSRHGSNTKSNEVQCRDHERNE